MTGRRQWTFYVGDPLPEEVGEPAAVLGGKGAGLQSMSRAGLPVPRAFVIRTDACRHFFENDHRWPGGLEEEVRRDLERLERDTGRRYGAGPQPLLLSVRSGAARSMPGMMDTLLNVGLHPALADEVEDPGHFWRLYTQFIMMFGTTVADLSPETFTEVSATSDEGDPAGAARRAIRIYEDHVERPFPTEPRELLARCIDAVFLSWHNERAVEYRRRNDIRGLTGTAVTVQAMFPSRVSGILFTRDPNTFEANHMIIEASWGLGEAVVSGSVSPDRYRVNREDPADYEVTPGAKRHSVRAPGDRTEHDPDAPCLGGEDVRRLWRLGLRVEEHFGSPRDIEWGLCEGEAALLQSRAIRGLAVVQDAEVGRRQEIARLRAMADGEDRVWVTHNLAETLRCPTPMTWDVMSEFMSGAGGFGRMYRDLGYQPSARVCEDGFLELICGRIYADPDRLSELFWDGLPMGYDLDAVVERPDLLNRAPDRFDPDRVEPDFLLKLPRILVGMVRNARRLGRLGERAARRFEQTALPPFLDYVAAERERDLAELSVPGLIDELDARCERVLGEFGKESLKPGFAGGMALQELRGMLEELAGPTEGARLANTLTMALEGDLSVAQDLSLSRVGAGEASLEEFLERHGHRAVGEMELMEPRWREDPGYVCRLADQMSRADGWDPVEMHERNVEKRRAALDALPERLREWGGTSLEEDIRRLVARVQELLPYRENGKYYLMMGYELIRRVLVELGQRWDVGNDVFFLRRDELRDFDREPGRVGEVVRDRITRWKAFKRLDMPDVVHSRDLDDLGLPRQVEGPAHRLRGEGVAAGVGRGAARIVFDPREAGPLGDDYVLVCPSTDPGWTSLFVRARALVVERGGALSHGAIVARDLGIPAVVCPDATRRITDGAGLRVDGNNGIITLMEE